MKSPMNRNKAFLLPFVLAVFASGLLGCMSSEMAEKAEARVRLEANSDEEIVSPPKDPRPRLVVDVSLSMAGYIAPPGHDASQFSQSLEAVASRLTDHELFIFGTRRAREGASLDDLLVPRTAGLGQDFATDGLFRGPNNQDDLLFQAVGRDGRPLVLFTDGVYSSPTGQGIHPVARSLDDLLAKGWSLGFIALRSAYYGTRCELVSGRKCGGARLFYSEANKQQSGSGFIPLPCPIIRGRPFYVVVLSPNPDLFDELHALLSRRFGAEAGFLLKGESPITLASRVEPVHREGFYDSTEDPRRWIMLTGEAGPRPAVQVDYSIESLFPVESVRWKIEAEQIPWTESDFSREWTAVNLPQPEPESEAEEEAAAMATPERLLWRSFSRDLETLRASLDGQIDDLGKLAARHDVAVRTIREWRPDSQELQALYCEYLDQPSLRAPSASLSALRILLAMDAVRRREPEEIPLHLEPLLLSTPSSGNAGFVALAKDLARSADEGQPQAAALSAANEDTLPAGRPPSRPSRVAAPSEAVQEAPDGRLEITVLQERGQGATYKIRLTPSPRRFSRHLKRLSTGDDSDIAFADRTYRLDHLIEYLAKAQLARLEAKSDLAVYVTVSGR